MCHPSPSALAARSLRLASSSSPKKNSKFGQQALKKKEQKELVHLIPPGANIQHADKKLKRFLVTQVPHLVQHLNPLK
jgi:hypothetical protein